MIAISYDTFRKLSIVFASIVLTLGMASAASWNSPDDNSVHDGDVMLSVDAPEDDVDKVEWTYEDPDGDTGSFAESSGSDDNYSYTFDKDSDASAAQGEYDFTPEAVDTSADGETVVEELEQRTLTIDAEDPDVEFPDSDYVGDDPTIEVEVSDDYSEVVDASADADNGVDVDNNDELEDVDCSAEETCTVDVELDTSDLDEGEDFDLDFEAQDEAGNTNSDTKQFTLDTSYEGDEDPNELSWDPEPEDSDENVFVLEDGDQVDLDVLLDDENADDDIEEDANTLECYDGDADDEDNLIESDEFDSADDDQLEASCEFDTDDDLVDDGQVDLRLKFLDEAGNSATSDEDTYVFDVSDPIVSLDDKEASQFNSEFDLSFDTSDPSGIDELEYYFDEDAAFDERNTVDLSGDESVDDSFTVDTSNLESGDQTVYVRVQDGADRWSSAEEFDFEYFPDQTPQVSVSGPSSVNVTAGSEEEIEVTVENTGELQVSDLKVEFSGLGSGSQDIGRLSPDESLTLTTSFTPSESDIGVRELVAEAAGLEASKTVEVRVEATRSQQQSIESELSTYESRLESLESNASDIKSQVGSGLADRVESNVSSFRSKVEEARQSADAGKYYAAQDALEGVDSDYSSAQSAVTEVRDIHNKRQSRMYVMAGAAVLLLALAGAGAFGYREGYFEQVDYEQYLDSDLDLSAVTEKFEELTGESEEEEESDDEFQWDGFN